MFGSLFVKVYKLQILFQKWNTTLCWENSLWFCCGFFS